MLRMEILKWEFVNGVQTETFISILLYVAKLELEN